MELFLAPLATFGAVTLLVLVLFPGKQLEVRRRVATFARTGAAMPAAAEVHLAERTVLPALESLGKLARKFSFGDAISGMQDLIDRAGNPFTVETLLALRVAGGLLLSALYVLLLAGSNPTIVQLLMAAGVCYIGSYAPKYWVQRRGARRRASMERGLPDALDLVVVSMEAGLSLDAALAKVVERSHGPLPQEIQRMLREMQLGKSRREALRDLASRCAVRDLTMLVNSIIQADQMGVSMAELMRTQAAESRVTRRQRAEERAHQASVKMVFPLVLFILPSLLIVAVGPAALTIYRTLITGGVFK